MKKATVQLDTLTCPSCAKKIESALKQLVGVEKGSVSVMFVSSRVKLDFDDEKLQVGDIEKAVTALGYAVIKSQVKPV